MIQKDFIRSELRYRYPSLAEQIRAPQQPVGRPLLFERGERGFGARIIVCDAADLLTFTGRTQAEPLFLCIGTPSSDVFDALDICVLPEYEQKSAVLNFVQRLFDRLDDWTQSLRQAAETGVEAEDLLTQASDMLQNPIVLLDERGHIVAASERRDVLSLNERFLPAAASENTKTLNIVQKLGDPVSPDALFVYMQSGTSFYTLLCSAADRPLYASDELVFTSLAGYLRLMLSQRSLRFGIFRKHREGEAAAEVFRALLSQDQSEQTAKEVLHRLGWDENCEYAVIAIEPEDRSLRAAHADAICDALEDELEACSAFAMLPVIVAVIQAGHMEEETLLAKLRSIAQAQKIRIGVCESLMGFSCFPERLEQAKRAINAAVDRGGVARYSEMIEDELVRESCATFPSELICMRSVLALAQFDLAHGTSYLETTEQYIGHHFNAVKTANALFIHRSTFLYRLERIKTQFGLDLDREKPSLLHLLLSLKIARELIR